MDEMCHRCIRERTGKGNGEKGRAVGDTEGSAGPAPVKGDWKRKNLTPAGVAQWIGCSPVNQRVAGLIPSQGTSLGCRPGPQ